MKLNIRPIVLCFLYLLSAGAISAQVTVGGDLTPERASILDIKTQAAIDPVSNYDATNVTSAKGGLGMPRVHLVNRTTLEPFISITDPLWLDSASNKIKEKHAGLFVYNTYVSDGTETDSNLTFIQALYVWDGNKWSPVTEGDSNDFNSRGYFTIPSVNIPLNQIGTAFTFDLYAEYKKQLTRSGNNRFVSSNAAIQIVPSPIETKLYERNELDYIITYFDSTVITNVSLDNTGVMKYDVLTKVTSTRSFVNVLFVVK